YVRVLQLRRRPRLALEALDAALAGHQFRLGHLQRDRALQGRIKGLVDPAERSLAEEASDLEAPNPLHPVRRKAWGCCLQPSASLTTADRHVARLLCDGKAELAARAGYRAIAACRVGGGEAELTARAGYRGIAARQVGGGGHEANLPGRCCRFNVL